MEKTMVLMIGIPGSGKSTFYRQRLSTDFVRVNLDMLKTREREKELISRCFSEGKSFVIDDTNVTRQLRESFILPARRQGYRIVGFYMRSSVSECAARNRQRTGAARVPDHVIANMSNRLELPSRSEGFDELYYVELREDAYAVTEWRENDEF